MQYKVKVTVLDKKLYPELQQEYCAVPDSGKCPCYYVGDEFLFYRNDERDDFWHMGAGTLVKSGKPAVYSPRERCIAEQKGFRSVLRRGMLSAVTFIRLCKVEASCMVGRKMIRL